MPVFWWLRLYIVFLVGRTVSARVFLGVCDLIMILGSLSALGWAVLYIFIKSIFCNEIFKATVSLLISV